MKFKYVGKKQQETAFFDKTGIVWTPDAVHDVANLETGKAMLKHPDVFEPVEEAPTLGLADAAKPPAPPAPPPEETPPAQEGQPADSSQTDETGNVPGADDAPRAKWIMRTDDGKPLVLDALDRDTLHKLADEAGLKIHANAKAETVAARLAEAFPWADEA